MKIGIFGGSFNPPHNMHTDIANYLINQHYVDKVIFVPTGSKYAYKNNLIEEEHRLNMLNILSRKNKNLMVSDFELKSEVVCNRYVFTTTRQQHQQRTANQALFNLYKLLSKNH